MRDEAEEGRQHKVCFKSSWWRTRQNLQSVKPLLLLFVRYFPEQKECLKSNTNQTS